MSSPKKVYLLSFYQYHNILDGETNRIEGIFSDRAKAIAKIYSQKFNNEALPDFVLSSKNENKDYFQFWVEEKSRRGIVYSSWSYQIREFELDA